jgi:hypothetical protein
MTPSEPSSLSILLWDYRFRLRRMKMSLAKFRLGALGNRALSRLLTSDELPFEILGLRFERAYRKRKEAIALENPSKEYLHQIVVERSFAVAGINRYVNIAVRPYTSVEEVARAYNHFTELTKKRYSYVKNPKVTETAMVLEDVTHICVVETQGDYMGDHFRIQSFACVVGKELLMVEFQCTATSQWALGDCMRVMELQKEKLGLLHV